MRRLIAESHRRRERGLRAELGEARRAAAAAEAALEGHRSQQEAGRAAVEAAETAYWEAEQAARGAAIARTTTREDLIRAEARRDAVELRRSELATARDRAAAELRAARAAFAELADADTVDAVVAPAISEAARAEEVWRGAITRLADADARLLAAEEELAAVRRSESTQLGRGRSRRRAAGGGRGAHGAAGGRARRGDGDPGSAGSRADDARARRGRHDVRAGTRRRSARGGTRRDRRPRPPRGSASSERLTAAERRTAAVTSELDALRERSEHGDRLGARLAASGWRTLLDAVDAPEAAWPAIEAVIGGELDQALAWDGRQPPDDVVAGAGGVARLAAMGQPAGTEGRPAALEAVGGRRTLAEWIGGSDLPVAFGRVAVAASRAALLAGWERLPAGWSAVTEEGDLADGHGVVAIRGQLDRHGGESARINARRRELTAEQDRLADERASTAAALRAAEADQAAASRQLATATATQSAAEQAAREAERELTDLDRWTNAVDGELERLRAELATLAASSAAPPSEATTGTASRVEALAAAAAVALQARDAAAASRDAAREAWQAARGAAEAAEARSVGRRKDRSAAEARIAQLASSIPDHERSLGELETTLAEITSAVAAVSAADAAAAARLRAAEEVREERRRQLIELERATGGRGSQLGDLERAAQAAAIAASRAEDGLAALGRERELALEGLPELVDESEPGDEPPQAETDLGTLDDGEVDAELRRVRRTLGQIGSVNPFAVEEHRELAARLGELTTQETDLTAAIGSTNELIATLEWRDRGAVRRRVRPIAARFDEFCQLLFAGGSASLQLSEGEDGEAPGGIEIVVRPPGKRLQRLAMLSGGERALAGVALLFAMLSVNPVPFCILDEVDAALDEANIGRFARRAPQALARRSTSW